MVKNIINAALLKKTKETLILTKELIINYAETDKEMNYAIFANPKEVIRPTIEDIDATIKSIDVELMQYYKK